MKTLRLFVTLLAFALSACATDPTEVVIVVDGEFATPDEVDSLELAVQAPDGTYVTSNATFTAGTPGFPRTVGLLKGRGPDGDYVVDVVANKNGTAIVRRTARFHFVDGQIRLLRIDLLRDCLGRTCTGDRRTCGEGGLCERIDVPTDPWSGQPTSQFDAGAAPQPIVVAP